MTRRITRVSEPKSRKSLAVKVWTNALISTETHLSLFVTSCFLKVLYLCKYYQKYFLTAKTCGGQLSGDKGSFSSPNFPNYYPPRTTCQWTIQVRWSHFISMFHKGFCRVLLLRGSHVTSPFSFYFMSILKVPSGKGVKITFKKFLLSEPGQENSKTCQKDYVEVDGKKWVPACMQ